MSKFKLTVSADNKIINMAEVEDSTLRFFYETVSDIQSISQSLQSNNVRLMKDTKIAYSFNENNELGELTVVPFDHQDPREYLFDKKENLDKFVKSQGMEGSVHLESDDIKSEIIKFFSGKPCSFEGADALYREYSREMDESGGADCTSCVRNSLTRKYQDKILEIIKGRSKSKQTLEERMEINKKKAASQSKKK